jgi:PAS domain S-box-containing protein
MRLPGTSASDGAGDPPADALRLARAQAAALEATATAIVVTDARARIEWVNAAFTRLTGYTAAEAIGLPHAVLRADPHEAGPYAAMWEAVTGGHEWHGELVSRRKDGSTYHEEVTVAPVRDDAGAIVRFVATKQDITARKEAEAALRASDERFRTLVDNLDAVLYSTDVEGRIVFANRAVEHFGYRRDDIVGRSSFDLVYAEDREEVRRSRAAHLAVATPATPPMTRELRLADASGKPRFVRLTSRALFRDDHLVGLTNVLVDTTEQHEAEEKLRASQKMEAVGRLAGGVAHDFNNLLSVIGSYTDLAIEALGPEDPVRGDLEEVRRAATRAEQLTRQLLAFSRRQVLQPKATSLAELARGLEKMLGRLIGEDVQLVLELDEGAALTLADPGQLEQVVMNLVVNARDAMPDGGRVTIATREADVGPRRAAALGLSAGRYVELAVADTGAGMDAATRARIFEPFFTTKGLGKGTGLGLSTVYGIVAQSGGGIEVESAPGRGTTFRVLLPRHLAGRPEPTDARAAPTSARGCETVLVVEDEAAVRDIARRILQHAGYRVLTAGSPGEALRVAETRGAEIRLVVTDVVMPGMNGRELATRVGPLCPSAGVLFMSGYTDESIERHGVLGENFLPKPFTARALCAKVRDVLDAPRRG